MYRILIADDEADIREGVAELIRQRCPSWEVDAQARDGREALDRAKQFLPHAVLTDITMPHVNGLDFLENLRGILPEAKLLVLSGYDQFEYAVQALRLGVSDYLLKPLDVDKLVDTLDWFAAELDEQARRWERLQYLNSQAEKVSQLEMRNYFRSALRGEKLPELSPDMAEYVAGTNYCCVICSGMGGRQELLDNLLEQRMGRSVRKVLLTLERPAELAVIFWTPEGQQPEFFLSINHFLASIAVHCKRAENLDVHFFIGSITDHPKKLRHSYWRSQQALGYAFPEQTDPVTAYEDVLESSLLPCPPVPEQLQQDIPTAVKFGNRSSFVRNCQKLFDWFREQEIRDATYMRMCVLSLCYAILRGCRETEEATYFEFTNFQAEVMASQSLEELRTHFENFVEVRWLRQKEARQPRRSLAERVAEVVRLHLANIDFSLDDVAAVLFISPNYLRQLFKQETGQTFTEYLTAQRMQHARMLLGNPKMRISDAAEQCGYADSRYFSVCFKKYWHMTPSEYQASVQKEK